MESLRRFSKAAGPRLSIAGFPVGNRRPQRHNHILRIRDRWHQHHHRRRASSRLPGKRCSRGRRVPRGRQHWYELPLQHLLRTLATKWERDFLEWPIPEYWNRRPEWMWVLSSSHPVKRKILIVSSRSILMLLLLGVEYDNMAYTTSMGFAATGDNSGHNGNTTDGRPFLNNPDVIIDFAYRARHSAVLLGKQLVSQYYGTPASKSYYYGCSTAGRQGLKAAQMFPDDFDGIVAGSPASDFNHLGSWSGHFLTLTGQNASDPRFMTLEQWLRVHAEILNQCDLLDGVADGILEDSSICNFNPETLLCSRAGANDTSCLTTTQAQTVRQVFSPLYGLNGAFIYPRLSPSAEVAAYEDGGFGYLNGNLEGPGTVSFAPKRETNRIASSLPVTGMVSICRIQRPYMGSHHSQCSRYCLR